MTPEERNTVIAALELAAISKLSDGTYLDKDCKMTAALAIMRREREPVAVNYAWECNECGSQEYTMSVSIDDVQNLGCSNCGGSEWHKAIAED